MMVYLDIIFIDKCLRTIGGILYGSDKARDEHLLGNFLNIIATCETEQKYIGALWLMRGLEARLLLEKVV